MRDVRQLAMKTDGTAIATVLRVFVFSPVAVALLYIISLPILLLIERALYADFGFHLVHFSSYGDRGAPRGEIRMAERYERFYRPILVHGTDSRGDLNSFGSLIFRLSHTHTRIVSFDADYEGDVCAEMEKK